MWETSFPFCARRFLERKLGKELSAKLRFASTPVSNIFVGVTFCVAPTFFMFRPVGRPTLPTAAK